MDEFDEILNNLTTPKSTTYYNSLNNFNTAVLIIIIALPVLCCCAAFLKAIELYDNSEGNGKKCCCKCPFTCYAYRTVI